MKYRRFAAFATAMLIMGMSYGCGDSSETSTGGDAISSADTQDNSDSGKSETNKSESGDSDDTQRNEDKSDNSVSESSKSDAAASQADGNSGSGDKSSDESSGGGSPAGNTSSSDGSSGGGNSGGTSSGGGASSGGGTSGNSGGSSQSSESSGDDEDKYTAEITLGSSPTFTGSNVTVEGSVVKITAGGDYRFTGSVSEGQIYVDTALEEKVKIVLNGVNISNSSGPAILVYEAKECTVKVQAGTKNTLSDGGSDKVNDGVIFSNDTLIVKGGGELDITSGNAHGIASDDDIIIENGTINITSIKSGLFAHDDITINGGTLNIKGGTNGIKSKGSVNINGGRAVVSGGTKEEKSSIYAGTVFNYTGGYVFAAGNKVTALSSSVNPYVVVDCNGSKGANSSVKLYLNGTEMAAFSPHNNFACILMLAPEISSGSSFGVEINGSRSDFTVSSGQNVFTL